MFFRDNNTTPATQVTTNIPSVPASFGPNVNSTAPPPPVNNINSTSNKENMSTAPPPSTTYAKEMSVREANGYVGFANLPNQVYRRAVKKGFEFTLLIVGKSACAFHLEKKKKICLLYFLRGLFWIY